jgi:elongation factor Ts
MSISANQVKELRDQTGAGMMDCKSALTETEGDIEKAIDWLRTKGLAKAAKKAGRVAAEGLIGVAVKGREAVVVELNSETDFVSRNAEFQTLVGNVAAAALGTDGSVEAIAAAKYPGTGQTVDEAIKEAIGTIGENLTLRRAARVTVGEGVIAHYVHNQVAPDLGKIGVLVALESSGPADKVGPLGKQLAMHVAAANPMAVSPEDVEPQVVERERAVYREQALESGKPEQIVERMVEGRIRKFMEEVALLSQAFVIDTEKTVAKAVENASTEIGAPIRVVEFVLFRLGEGVERNESDFAAEVAAAAGVN